MKTNRVISVFCLLLLSLLMAAEATAFDKEQVTESDTLMNDITGRVGLDFSFKVCRNLYVDIENSLRFRDDFRTFDRNYLTGSVSYKPIRYFKAGAGYTFMSIWHDGKKSTGYRKYWDLRHRAHADVSGILPVGRWKFTLRERAIATFRTLDYDPLEKVSPAFVLRSKISAEYTSRRLPLQPYVSVELSNTLNVPEYVSGNYIEEIRNKVGVKWRLTRRSRLDFYYRLDLAQKKDVDIDYKKDKVTIKGVDIMTERSFVHIFGITYSFDYH
ncbi:MAG: DUF2490 domain-containing protein [Bacteroidales bacterium]|nr:DUF2490 domain-containing protein [Bacteroidales bacterium]